MEELTLARYEAQGNDFLIALLTESQLLDLDASLDDLRLGRCDLARVVCDRDLGVGDRRGYVHSTGADGFVVGEHNALNGQRADWIRMHLLNADGSFAETSGNGLATLAGAAFDAGIIPEGVVTFRTDAGTQHCTIGPDDIGSKNRPGANGRFVRVAMRKVGDGPAVPRELSERIRSNFGGDLRHIGTGDVGNPHLVIALARPPIDRPISELSNHAAELGDRVAKLGHAYEAYFPNGINVEFIWPHSPNPLEPDQAWTLQMSVWERGAGLTVSCGSGSVVAATLAHRWGLVRSPNDPPDTAAEEGHDGNPPSSYPVDMRTAPFPGDNGSGFRYRVQTVPAVHEDFVPPQLGVVAERIETDLTFQLDHLPTLLDDLDSMTAPQR